ncbi:MAG: pentapeptide repeat-containing protein [Halopseudomonas sp.]
MIDLEKGDQEYLAKRFDGLDLSGETLFSAEFDGCTFSECNFSEAVFHKCKFLDCSFVKCNLSVVRLQYSQFLEVTFDRCKVIGVDWTQATWPTIALSSSIKFSQSILNDSSFFGLNLQQLAIEDCKAQDVDFREANLREANFSHTDLSHSLFNHTNLSAANFVEAFNYHIDIHFNEVKGAAFSRHEAVSLLDSLGIELVD